MSLTMRVVPEGPLVQRGAAGAILEFLGIAPELNVLARALQATVHDVLPKIEGMTLLLARGPA